MNYNQPSVLIILLERHVIRITDDILFKMDNDEVKFRKAFDVIDHNLLSKKLSVCGQPDSGAWFYISGRTPTVC